MSSANFAAEASARQHRAIAVRQIACNGLGIDG